MSVLQLLSDHVNDWSDGSIQQVIIGVAKTPPNASAPTAAVGCDPARLADRALQALWEARLQVRRRPRSWPEVLPVGELSGRTAPDGLRAAGRPRRDPHPGRQLPHRTNHPGGDLRDQPRALTAPRGAVSVGGERSTLIAHPIDRYRRRRTAPGQYDRALARHAAPRGDERGGER
jgi:hypothetical protein